MQLITAKNAEDVQLYDITVDIEYRDNQPFAITFTDCMGQMVKVSKGNYSDLNILIPAPPKMVEKYELSGSLAGVADISDLFETEYEAEEKKREIEKKFGYSDEVQLEVKKVEVEE